MKKYLFIIVIAVLTACGQSAEDKAQSLFSKIESLYAEGKYQQTLDSIKLLREKHPEAITARQKALKIWQEASLKLTQNDIAKTDSALQATIVAQKEETNLYKKNMLGVKRDSLQARFDGLCGTVRLIRYKQKNN